jgi:microcystin-dependent protein
MSRNGSGTYILPTGNPVTTGTAITSNWGNTTMSDIATALTGSIAADGQTPITGNLQMGNNKITGMADPSSAQDAATKSYVDTGLAALTTVPSGSMFIWPTVTSPTGWLICNGSAISRTTYATLFAVIGTTYGVGDGSTTFNLPDLRGRSPFGVSGSYALASTGGSADAVVVSHTHTATSTVTDSGHSHVINGSNDNAQTNNVPVMGRGQGTPPYVTANTATATTGITVATTNASAGVSGTGANLPPYLAINFIIKV